MTAGPKTAKRSLLLKTRLGLGAAVLGSGTLLTAVILYFGMQAVASRLETALASETRMARYAVLSTQAATFLVIATESVQTGQSIETRIDRLSPIRDHIGTTFLQLRSDVEAAVAAVQSLGLDEQSRYGTQSLGLARMEALLANTLEGLADAKADQAQLRAHIDSFASAFDPLLSQSVNTEVLFRNAILAGIERTRLTLTWVALALALFALLSTAWFYFGLVRPQFSRLDRLSNAAVQVGKSEFAISLPETRNDEIGQLYGETNRMAAALKQRQGEVEAEWARLNETIARRTLELSAANKSLSKIDENRRRFFADISHELRTPLTVIMMESQIGQHDCQTAPETLATIENSAAKLNQRIDDLLRVARSETGELALEPSNIELHDLMQTVVCDIQPEIDSANMQLEVGGCPDCSLHCDPNWIRQVLLSLIRNAIRHARDGKVIAFSGQLAENVVQIQVTDNGPGIPENTQIQIFERFVRGATTNSQGFGVGLALAKWIVEAHDGSISVTSPVTRDNALGANAGTNICIRLPQAEA